MLAAGVARWPLPTCPAAAALRPPLPRRHNMRPHQKLILIEQYGAGTFMIPDDMQARRRRGGAPAGRQRRGGAPAGRQRWGGAPAGRAVGRGSAADAAGASCACIAGAGAWCPTHRPRAAVACHAWLLQDTVEGNRTLAVVKHILVQPPERQNGPYLEDRAHLGARHAAAAMRCRPCTAAADAVSAAVAAWRGRGCWLELRRPPLPALTARRPRPAPAAQR